MAADIASVLASWSATEGSNQPDNSDPVGPNTLAENLRMIQAVVRAALAGDGTIAAASSTDLSTIAANFITVTGNTGITGFGTVSAGIIKVLYFTGTPAITYNASSLVLIGRQSRTTVAGDVSIVRSEGSGNWRELSFFPAQGHLGTNTNDNAAAGKIGEYIESIISTGSAVALTTNTAKNVTSISLTAGDWDVSGNVAILSGNASTSFTQEVGSISTTTDTLDTTSQAQNTHAAFVPGNGVVIAYLSPNTARISISSTTTVYLVARSTFTVSTASAFGKISARRVR